MDEVDERREAQRDGLGRFAASARPARRMKPHPGLPNIAVVLDEFSMECFGAEANLWPVRQERTALDIDFIKPDLLLVESAWNANSGAWRYALTSSSGPRASLVKLVEHCRKAGIPTAFWNKEDPPHFEEFLPVARLFDVVFTTDEDMVPHYESKAPGVSASMMRFAASTQLHSPERVSSFREGDIAFAGQYFAHKYPERRQQMDLLFQAALAHDFSIFSRALGGRPEYQFPPPFNAHVKGALPYSEMVKEYRRHKVFLNVNSVTTSRTMCARRVFELSASKTAVVGTSSEAISAVYPANEVWLVDSPQEARECFDALINDEWRRRWMTQRAWRRTISQHTYSHRLRQILASVGHDAQTPHTSVHVVLTGEGEALEGLVRDLSAQDLTNLGVEISLTLGSGLLDRSDEVQVLADRAGHRYKETPPPGADVAWMNADYTYGPHYLSDLILTMRQQGTDVVAKTLVGREDQEESRVSDLPPHGWLATSRTGERWREWVRQGALGMGATDVGGASIYQTDPLELAPRGMHESVSLAQGE